VVIVERSCGKAESWNVEGCNDQGVNEVNDRDVGDLERKSSSRSYQNAVRDERIGDDEGMLGFDEANLCRGVQRAGNLATLP
jgi:hypothetical protein